MPTGIAGSLYVGLKEGAGICRALIKFPGLSALPSNVTVQSATLTMRDLMCQSTAMDIYCYTFNGNDWSESGATWSGTNAGSASSLGTHLCTVTMDYDIGVTYTSKHWYTFDITAAVRSWGNGSTGKGILLKMPDSHENGSTYTYRTIGSYNRSANKPTLSVSYSVEGGTIEVEEGKTVTLSASEISGTITWASSNTDIATVNGGVVTGVHAGAATITAAVNGVVQKTFNVRVLLPDGVYWIGSAIEGLYMSADSGSISNGTAAELHSLYSGLPNNLLQLWKICYLGNELYSIRPMHKLDMALRIDEDYVDLCSVGITDTLSGLPNNCKWYIAYESGGYSFFNYEGFALSYPSWASEGTQLCGDSYAPTDVSFRWSAVERSIPPSGIVFFDTNKNELCTTATIYAEVSQTKTLAEMGLVVSVYSGHTNSQAVVWQSGDNNTATVQSVSGSATGRQRGETTVTVTTIIDSVMYSVECTLIVCKTIYVINRYDSTIASDTALVESIDDAVDFLNVIYRDEFYLNFEMDGTPQLYADAFIAECEFGVTAHCTKDVCGGVCTEHHKNLFRIAYDLYDQFWQANHIVVKWSNCPPSTYCQGNHVLSNSYAVTAIVNSEPLPIVQVLCIKEESGCTAEGFMAVNLAHEVAHTLGVQEVYLGAYKPEDIATHLEYYLDSEKTMPCVMAAITESHIDALYQGKEAALCDNCRGYLESEIPDDPYAE